MKSFRSTGVLSLLMIALVGYTAWEYRKASQNAGDTPEERHLFTFHNEDVQEIHLIHPKDSVVIVRENGEWQMKKPREDLVESTAVDALLYSVAIQKGKVFRAPDDPKDKTVHWADFGLEPPGTVLEIKTANGSEQLGVSSKNAFDGSFYLRQGEDLLLGDSGLAQAIFREPNAFRSKRLFREREGTIVTVQASVQTDDVKDQFTVQRDGEKWRLKPDPGFPVDMVKMDQWVSAAQSLVPSEIVAETLSDDERRADLLVKPSLVLNVDYKKVDGTAAKWSLTAGQDKDEDIYVYSSQRPTVYKANRSALAGLRVDREYFRDGKQPFQFNLEAAREIHVQNGEFDHSFKKDSGTWTLSGAKSGETIDTDKLMALLQNVGALEAVEFLPASTAKGVRDTQQIRIQDERGKVLLQLSWGEPYKAKRSFNKGANLRFVKSSGAKEILGVHAAKVLALVDPGLIQLKVEKRIEKKAEKKAEKK